jgi:hypothetical protein
MQASCRYSKLLAVQDKEVIILFCEATKRFPETRLQALHLMPEK